jgi:hypothetical protein
MQYAVFKAAPAPFKGFDETFVAFFVQIPT